MQKKITTLYQMTRLGKVQQWKIWVESRGKSGFPEVWVQFGQKDGKQQLTSDIIESGVNEGKANETTALEQACLMLDRKVKKQKEHGYSADISDLGQDHTIDFTERLSKNLCFYKPVNSLNMKKLAALEVSNSAIMTEKRDGMMHVVRTSDTFGVEIYSRRMDLVTDKYPHLAKELANLPAGIIFLGEIILDDNGNDDFNGVSQICRSDADKAATKQEDLGKVSYYIFDMAFRDGENIVSNVPYKDRLSAIGKLVNDFDYISKATVLSMDHESALACVSKRGIEGLVVWDGNSTIPADQAFTLNGKAYRPRVLWKSKPKFELDAIARFDPENEIGEYGTGKNNGRVKSVYLYQLDDDGNETFICKCGGGLSDMQRSFYTTASYPRVWRIEYDSVQVKTGSLRFPIFNADRTIIGDKSVDECFLSEEIKESRKDS